MIITPLYNIKQETKLDIDIKQVELELHNTDNHDYNCWGFTAYVLDMRKNLLWLADKEMQKLLKLYTRKINRPKIGDVVVWCASDVITHTAIICEMVDYHCKIIHKPGGWALNITYLDSVINAHEFECYGGIKEYRRIKR